MFINDRFPKACNKSGIPLKDGEWHLENTLIKRSASIGSGAVILCGVTIGEGALIGAGAVVTKDVDAFSVVSEYPLACFSIQPMNKNNKLAAAVIGLAIGDPT